MGCLVQSFQMDAAFLQPFTLYKNLSIGRHGDSFSGAAWKGDNL